MRRWLTATALSGVIVLALTGCGNPGGVDGELTDDWAMVSEPKIFTPEAGICVARDEEVGYLSAYNPLDCTSSHEVEIVHVGTLTGEHAERSTPPPAGSPGARAAYAECDKKVIELIGADWRTGRLKLTVVFPSPAAWNGTARWFRCDLAEVFSVDESNSVSRKTGLAGALKPASDLALGCFSPRVVSDDIKEMRSVSCTRKHRAEFVGLFTAPDTTFAAFEKNTTAIHKGCRKVIATYVKVPNDRALSYRTGSIFYPPSEDEWNAGVRGVQCFLWTSDRDLTRSVKGGGAKALPLR